MSLVSGHHVTLTHLSPLSLPSARILSTNWPQIGHKLAPLFSPPSPPTRPFNVAPPPLPVLTPARPRCVIKGRAASQAPPVAATAFSAATGAVAPSFVQSSLPPPRLLTIPPPAFPGAAAAAVASVGGGAPPPIGAAFFGPVPASAVVLSRPPPTLHNVQNQAQPQQQQQYPQVGPSYKMSCF